MSPANSLSQSLTKIVEHHLGYTVNIGLATFQQSPSFPGEKLKEEEVIIIPFTEIVCFRHVVLLHVQQVCTAQGVLLSRLAPRLAGATQSEHRGGFEGQFQVSQSGKSSLRETYCQTFVSPGIGATVATFLPLRVLMIDDLPVLGYPIRPTETCFLSAWSFENCRKRLITFPLPNGLFMEARKAAVG